MISKISIRTRVGWISVFEKEGKIFKDHRDKSSSCYIRDIDGNHIEFLKWPKKNG